jgi:hypothetical protein
VVSDFATLFCGLKGLLAAAIAGLGVTVRTPLGLRPPLAVLSKSNGLPKLPQTTLSLYTAQPEPHRRWRGCAKS